MIANNAGARAEPGLKANKDERQAAVGLLALLGRLRTTRIQRGGILQGER